MASETFIKFIYYMACVCNRYNARSDWLILGLYSPVKPTGRLGARKTKAKSHIIEYVLTSKVRSLWENLKAWPCRIARSQFSIFP